MGTTSTKERMCPECGASDFKRDTRLQEFTYREHTTQLPVAGLYCKSCGEGIVSGDDIKTVDLAYAAFRAGIDGVLPPKEVLRIRVSLKLTQEEAGEILGGGPRAFEKYERGKTPPSLAMSNLLVILGTEPSLVERLPSFKMRLQDEGERVAKVIFSKKKVDATGGRRKKTQARKTKQSRKAAARGHD